MVLSRNELGLRIATDWVIRQPLSIRAFQTKLMLLRDLGREAEATKEETARLVEVEFLVTTTNTLPSETILFLIGNASSLGTWDDAGLADSAKPIRSDSGQLNFMHSIMTHSGGTMPSR